MSLEAAHYWQACAEVDSLGQLAEAAEARTPSASKAVASSAEQSASPEYPGHISQGVWVGRYASPPPPPLVYISFFLLEDGRYSLCS